LIRVTPRYNPDINDFWMCDIGRFGYTWVGGDSRLRKPTISTKDGMAQAATWKDALTRVRDVVDTAGRRDPASVRFLTSAHAEAPIRESSYFKALEKDLKDSLYQQQALTVYRNKALKLYSRIGESAEAFELRCRKMADQAEDEAAAVLRERYEKRIKRTRDLMEKAEDRLEEMQVDYDARKTDEILSGVGSVLGMFLGGRKSSRGIATDLRRASSKRKQTRSTNQRLQSASNRLEDQVEKLEDIENELADALLTLDEEWDAQAGDVEQVAIGLEKTDISIEQLALVWIPV
jgi:NADH dehydrogenase/NADH:ubiquinone oxidoreductase subunit G